MSKFWWISISYVIYVLALHVENSIAAAYSRPVLAYGFWTSWWMVAIVFGTAYLSEWAVVVYQKY